MISNHYLYLAESRTYWFVFSTLPLKSYYYLSPIRYTVMHVLKVRT